jgi:hypothetical protein
MTQRLALLLAASLAAGCSSMLPHSNESTVSPWENYQEAQEAFDQLVPGETTAAELKGMKLDPGSNPNITILNYSDVLRRFLLNQSISVADLDQGVRDCVAAKTSCRGFEINQKIVNKKRKGNFWLDLFGFKRETHTDGWSFAGLILMKDGIVVYKLTGGQPAIVQEENSQNPLGPVQAVGNKLLGGSWF